MELVTPKFEQFVILFPTIMFMNLVHTLNPETLYLPL